MNKDYLLLAETLFYKYQKNHIHYKDVWRHLEHEPECKGLDEEILEAIETYIRYNRNDFSLKDNDIAYAKEFLRNR